MRIWDRLVDWVVMRWLEKRSVMVTLRSDGLEVEMTIGGVPVLAEVEYLPTGHWHQRQLGPEDEQGMAMFEADWISGAQTCDDCVTA